MLTYLSNVQSQNILVKKGTTLRLNTDSIVVEKLIMEDSSTIDIRGLKNWNLLAKESYIGNNCRIIGTGESGKDGINGRNGESANEDCNAGKAGMNGTPGENAGNGTNVYISSGFKQLGTLSIITKGGDGGRGGKGGDGGNGGKGDVSRDCRGGNGGNGGNGGDAGKGGNGGDIVIFYMSNGLIPNFGADKGLNIPDLSKGLENQENVILVNSFSGENGRVGLGGRGGKAGSPVSRNQIGIKISKGGGADGSRGRDGTSVDYPKDGITEFGIVQLKNGNLSLQDIPSNLLNELNAEYETKYHAIIIYNEEYEKAKQLSAGIFEKSSPKKNAMRFKDVLNSYYYINGGIDFYSDLGEREMYERLRTKLKSMGENDNLLIFYTGHGFYDTLYERTYWIPIDGDGPPNSESWFDLRDLIDYLSTCKAKNVLVITDACYGGGLFVVQSLDPFPEMTKDLKVLYNRKARIAITSGNIETVPKKSPFCDHIINFLEENGKKRNNLFLTSNKLFEDTRLKIINDSEASEKNGKIPVPARDHIRNTGDNKGEFIFILKEKKITSFSYEYLKLLHFKICMVNKALDYTNL